MLKKDNTYIPAMAAIVTITALLDPIKGLQGEKEKNPNGHLRTKAEECSLRPQSFLHAFIVNGPSNQTEL